MISSRAPVSVIDEDHNSIYGGSWLVDRVLWCNNPGNGSGSIHSFNNDEAGSYERVREILKALIAQLNSSCEELKQMTAGSLRNLTWGADQSSKKALRDIGAVAALMKAAMETRNEVTLRSILAALWNLSAHCSMNKADICSVEGGLSFLISTLVYSSASNSCAIIESGGGILRNISSHIAVREDYRAILREHDCLAILLQHLRSSNHTIVSHACGALWNLSARSVEDQQILWELGAVSILKQLVKSKHKMISMGSSAALKNLLQARPGSESVTAKKMLPGSASSLHARKVQLSHNVNETYESLNNQKMYPTRHSLERKMNRHESEVKGTCRQVAPFELHGRMYGRVENPPSSSKVSRCESKDSVFTTKSDSYQYRLKSLNMRVRNHQSHPVSDNEDVKIERTVKVPLTMHESRSRYVKPEIARQMAAEGREPLGRRNQISSRILKNVDINHSSETMRQNNKPMLYNYSNITTMMEKLRFGDEETEEPHDYSFQYEEKSKPFNKVRPANIRGKTNQNIYSPYAETDLDGPDQVTNYGLRYSDDSDTTSDFRKPLPKTEKSYLATGDYHAKQFSCNDDTFRTYCTEDTPLSISNATSMSDLREIRDAKPDKMNFPTIQETVNDSVVKYCVEDTPVCFSRVSSLSSLDSDSDAVNDHPKNVSMNEKLAVEETSETKQPTVSSPKQDIATPDKTVHFEEDQLVEQTPLMFSRCSSMESLSSFEVNSIHDDRSSVISDFSRRASEVVSPSDLPDSPGEKTCTFDLPHRHGLTSDPSKQLCASNCKPSDESEDVFEDSSRVYAIEGTPLQFSKATSLSSLPTTPPADNDDRRDGNKLDDSILEDDVSDFEEDGEDLLAACINSAMPKSKFGGSLKKSNVKQILPVNDLNKYDGRNDDVPRNEISVKSNNFNDQVASNFQFDHVSGNSDQDSNSDADSSFDEDNNILTQCIQSGMPSPLSSKPIVSKKQNYVPNLSRCQRSASSIGSAMINRKASNLKIGECESDFVARLPNTMNSLRDDKNFAYKSLNTNVEANPSKLDDNKNKQIHSKTEFNPCNDKRERQSNASFSSNVRRDGRANEEGPENFLQFEVEDTPVRFSDNSSLSSLSIDSGGLDSAASDQALLDECINSGKPSNSHNVLSKRSAGIAEKKTLLAPKATESQQKTHTSDQKKGVNRPTSISGSHSKHLKGNKLSAQKSNTLETSQLVRRAVITKEESHTQAISKAPSMKTKIPTFGNVNAQPSSRLTPPLVLRHEEKQLAGAVSQNMSLQSKISGRRGQSVSPVMRNINSHRVLGINSQIAATTKNSPTTNLNNKGGVLEYNKRQSPVPSKYQLGSPKLSSSNASLCSSTGSSTTSANSDNRYGKKKDLSKTNARLNALLKSNKAPNAAVQVSSQKKDSASKKLNVKGRLGAKSESSSSKLNKNSQIPTAARESANMDENSSELSDEDGKQPCLVTYL